MKSFLTVFLYILSFGILFSQQIILDERYDDWNISAETYNDTVGDGGRSGIDFSDIRITNDDRFLYLYFDVGHEINLQEDNDIVLYIDMDNNHFTGYRTSGIGAEIVYYPGKRSGFLYSGNSNFVVNHSTIGFVSSPTVTSDRFEIALKRNFVFNNQLYDMAGTIKIRIEDEASNGDKVPDFDGGLTYTMQDIRFEPQPLDLNKKSENDLRIVSYNVLNDKIFNNSSRQYYDRIFKATNPDILGFCEIYDHSSQQTATLMETFLPSENGQTWYHSGVNPDIRVVSRYPIIRNQAIDGNGAFLIDLGIKKLVFIIAHLPCCNNEVARQREVDNIMAFVRGVRYGISNFSVPPDSPIVIAGDMNFVGLNRQPYTMLSGDIFDNNSFGPDFNPDWNETSLNDAKPLTTGLPMTFTWNSSSSYSAGRLDYVFYTGSVMNITNRYVLWTEGMSNQDLNRFNLKAQDITRASDHCPVVVDFDLSTASSTTVSVSEPPFIFRKSGTNWLVKSIDDGILLLSDLSGQTLIRKSLRGGIETSIDIPNYSGIYVITFVGAGGVFSTKVFR